MGVILLLVATGALVLGSMRLAERWFPGSSPARLLTIAVLTPTGAYVDTLVVGSLARSYEPLPITIGALALGAIGWLAGRGRAGVVESEARAAHPRSVRVASGVLCGVVGTALAFRALVAVVLPPNAYDSLAYHLPTIGEWVRTGRVAPTKLTNELCCAWYPMAGDAWTGWSAVFLGNDRLIGLAQVWFAVVIWLAGSLLARTWGADLLTARCAGALAAGMPIVLAQADTAYVDVTYAGALAAAYAYLAHAASPSYLGRPGPVAGLCGAAIGLAAAVKGTGIVGGAVCGLALVIVLVLRWRGRAVRPAAVAFVVAAALALPWYLAAWSETGNPIEPYELRVRGQVVFEGEQSYRDLTPPPPFIERLAPPAQPVRSWLEDLRVATPGFRYGADTRAGGFGPLFALGALPALAWLLLRGAGRGDRRVALAAVTIAALVTLALQPYAWWTRFTIPVGVVGMVAVACAVGGLRPRVRAASFAVMSAVVALGALKVGVGNSEVVAQYSRGEVVRSSAAWLIDRPTLPEAMPQRFGALATLGAGPVLIERRADNRTSAVAMGHGFGRHVIIERFEVAEALERATRLRATDVVLDRRLVTAPALAELDRAGDIYHTDRLVVVGLSARRPKR